MFSKKEKDCLQEELQGYYDNENNQTFEEKASDFDVQGEYDKEYNRLIKNQPPKSFNSAAWGFTLIQGETVLWEGDRHSGGGMAANGENIVAKIMALSWLVLSIFWTLITFMSDITMALFGIPFILVGITLFTMGKGKAHYIITDRRVIIIEKKKNTAEFLTNVVNVSYIAGKKNLGTVFYQTDKTERRRDSDGGYYTSIIGGKLTGVESPAEVYNILCNAIYRTRQ